MSRREFDLESREQPESRGNVIEDAHITFPDREVDGVRLTFTSSEGMSGCQGLVLPGILEVEGESQNVQVKRFYRNTYDDNGEYFSQDPDKEAQDSYDAFLALQKYGFRTVPFFALLSTPEAKFLVMTDLTCNGENEVIDEKAIHRDFNIRITQNGQEIVMRCNEVLDNLDNKGAVELGFLHTVMLQYAYEISFGFPGGVAHMLVRKPSTNTGNLVVTDVGEFWQEKSKYRDEVDFDALMQIPEQEIQEVFTRILSNFHPDVDSKLLYQFYEISLLKKSYHDLFYKAGVGMALRRSIGYVGNDLKWVRQRFIRKDFSDHILRTKKTLYDLADSYYQHAGEDLFSLNSEFFSNLLEPKSPQDLIAVTDLAFLATLDRRMQYLNMARDALDNEKSLPPELPSLQFDENGLPRMVFFENFDEVADLADLRCVVNVVGHSLKYDEFLRLNVEMDYRRGERVHNSGGMSFVPAFTPEQIKGLEIERFRAFQEGGRTTEPLDFDPSKLALYPPISGQLEIGDSITYVYDGQIIYSHKIKDVGEIDLLKPYLASIS